METHGQYGSVAILGWYRWWECHGPRAPRDWLKFQILYDVYTVYR